ncbi:START domain containing 14 [Polypterus senegalus]|uniref:START domain containing 14 n=1 Tax=Polypterus senegalus TaxID=55291 RepID=UPI0019628D27|nr:START domain containing 14 [Polypterus senegalus]
MPGGCLRPPMARTTVEVPDDTDFNRFQEECESQDGWISKYKKSGMEVLVQPPPSVAAGQGDRNSLSTIHRLKCRMEVKDVSAATMYDVLHDGEYRRKWDSSAIESFDIARITANADVGYYSWKCPKPLKNRDVVTLRSWLVKDGEYMIINYSVKHPKYPPSKDLVRAVSILTGYLVKSTGPKSCTLIYMSQADPKGSLPKWVVNKASQYLAPKVLKKIHKASQRYEEWKVRHSPDQKPWLYPEQNTLPSVKLSELSIQRAESLEQVDESTLNEEKESEEEEDRNGVKK